jgi:hypothetical protein
MLQKTTVVTDTCSVEGTEKYLDLASRKALKNAKCSIELIGHEDCPAYNRENA